MEGTIRLMIYEKSPLYRGGLRLLLQREKDFEVVMDTGDSAQAVAYVLQDHIDLCLANLDLLHSNWDQYGSFLWELGLKTQVLILSNSLREDLMLRAMQAGMKGYLSMDIPAEDLVRAIREISCGGIFFQARSADGRFGQVQRQPTLQYDPSYNLTAQEIRVLEMIRQRLRNKEIANRLNISEKTVKCHVNKIFKKLKISKRLQAMDHPFSLISSHLFFFSSLLFA
jgi:two-component system nitrate/nitrite response regulator NarP